MSLFYLHSYFGHKVLDCKLFSLNFRGISPFSSGFHRSRHSSNVLLTSSVDSWSCFCGLVPPCPFSLQKPVGSSLQPQSSEISQWYVIFSHCTRHLREPFNLETYVLRFWEILLKHFIDDAILSAFLFSPAKLLMFGCWFSLMPFTFPNRVGRISL